MARNSTGQSRETASRHTAADQGAQRRRPVPASPKDTEPKAQARQQPPGRRHRPFAPGEDGESH